MLVSSGKRIVLLLAAIAAAAGCSPREMQQEVGTPAARYAGEAVVLLPRTCTTERSVPARHFFARTLEAPETTPSLRLRAALDGLVKPSAAAELFAGDLGPAAPTPRPQEACMTPPDLAFAPTLLSDLRATDETLRMMRERGARHVVVLEVHAVVACAQRAGLLLERWGIDPRAGWSADDVCLEDEVTLSAYVFRDDGAAVWALTRELRPDEDPGWAVDRVLERVPVTMPRRPHS